MKRLFLALFGLLFIISAHAQERRQINSFDELMESLKKGNSVTAVFHYKDCQLIADNEIEEESVDAIGGMKLETWEFFEKGSIRNKQAFLVSSASHLIENPKGEGYVYNYVKLKVYDDNNARIIARYVKTPEMKEIMDESFYCDLNDGKNGGGVYLFTK